MFYLSFYLFWGVGAFGAPLCRLAIQQSHCYSGRLGGQFLPQLQRSILDSKLTPPLNQAFDFGDEEKLRYGGEGFRRSKCLNLHSFLCNSFLTRFFF